MALVTEVDQRYSLVNQTTFSGGDAYRRDDQYYISATPGDEDYLVHDTTYIPFKSSELKIWNHACV